MTNDHYATLGVVPASEDVVIRAAYLALMRRYHPDRNDSPAAIERAQAVIEAFAVLGDPELRMKYDWERRRAAEAAAGVPARRMRFSPRGLAMTLIVLLSMVTVVALRAHLARRDPPAPVVAQQVEPATARMIPALAPVSDDCVAAPAQAAIKRQLLSRAAAISGNQAGFAQRLAASTVRVGPATFARHDPFRDRVECTAAVTLALPAGLVFAGGQRAVVAELDYSLRRGTAAGDPPIRISNGDIIAMRLAAFARPIVQPLEDRPPPELAEVSVPTPAPRPAPALRPAPSLRPTPIRAARPVVTMAPTLARPALPRPTLPRPAPRPVAEPRRTAVVPPAVVARPKAATVRVAAAGPAKKNDNIVALERNTSAFYNQSYAYGKGAKRTALLSSRHAYLARREACRSDGCLRGVHLTHMREIATVMQSGSTKPAP